MTRSYNHLFGPVPSRRLGRSLGVDLTPRKTCSFDCVFCQLGRTTRKTVSRGEYVPTGKIIEELCDWMKREEPADVITLSGSGEPTLHSRFGEIIDRVRSSTSIPAVLLTNGSLLSEPTVREAAAGANIVKVSVSAWNQLSFEQINRPHPTLKFSDLVEGGRALRKILAGELWIEVFVVPDMNDSRDGVRRIADLVESMQPNRVQLNTAVRPPAEDFVQAAATETLAELAPLFDPPAEVAAEFSWDQSFDIDANESTILDMLARRPCTPEQIATVFGMHVNEVSKYLGKLTRTRRVRAAREGSDVYYVARTEREHDVRTDLRPKTRDGGCDKG